MFAGKHGKFESKFQFLITRIKTGYIPIITFATRHNKILAGIAVYELCFIPSRRNFLQHVKFELRKLIEIVRHYSNTLHIRLRDISSSNFENVGGMTRVAALVVARKIFVEHSAAIVHCCYCIASKGKCGKFLCLTLGTFFVEINVFGSPYSLGSYEIRVHSFPTTGQRAAMEYHENSEVVCIGKNILIQLHGFLFVATKEVHFYSCYTRFFKPFHLLAALKHRVHEITRSLRRIIPRTVGIIPQNEAHTFGSRIFAKLCHALTSYVFFHIPIGINETILIAHLSSHVYERFLVVVVY